MSPTSVLYRPETLVIKIADVVPSANATVNVPTDQRTSSAIAPLGAGIYYMGIIVTSSVTGTTTVLNITPFTNSAKTQLGDPYTFYDQTGAEVANVTLPAGANGLIWPVNQSAGTLNNAPTHAKISIPFGLQVGITKGGAVTGELLEVYLICQRVS